MNMLKFSPGKDNAKLMKLGGGKVYTFSLMSGYTCPFANECLSKAVENNGKWTIKDGPNTQYRCFSASQEVLFPALRNQRKHNTDLLRQCMSDKFPAVSMFRLLIESLPNDAQIVRIHVAGDFFNRDYFRAWCAVASMRPNIKFYAYTKSLKFWIKDNRHIPPNLVLTASFGGHADHLINEYGLRYAKVVFSEQEAESLGLPIDHDDSHAASNGGNFALLIHGVQPKGSKASQSLSVLKGKGSYSRVKNNVKN